MEAKNIIAEILKHNRELSKSSRFYKLTHEEQAEVIINSEPKFKNLGLFGVVFSGMDCKYFPCFNGGEMYCDHPKCSQYENNEA